MTKIAARAKFDAWLKDRSNQAGAAAAGQVILDGAVDDPWGSISRGIGTFFGARAQDRQRAEAEAKRDAALAREQTRQDSKDAMDIEQFELNKQVAQAKLAEDVAKREAAERSRQALAAHIGSLPPEDQKLLAPYAEDLDKFFPVYDDLMDDRRAAEQFGKTFGETTRHNKVTEANTSASLANERERIRLSEEGMSLKSGKQQMKKMGNFIITTDALGREISREALPENPAERRNAVIRIARDNALSPAESVKVLDELDAELGIGSVPGVGGPMVTHRPTAQATGTDEELLAAIEAAREAGLSDDDIMRSLAGVPAPERARALALMQRR